MWVSRRRFLHLPWPNNDEYPSTHHAPIQQHWAVALAWLAAVSALLHAELLRVPAEASTFWHRVAGHSHQSVDWLLAMASAWTSAPTLERWRDDWSRFATRARLPRAQYLVLFAIALSVVAVAVSVARVAAYATRDLPPVDRLFSSGMFQTVMIYDRKGRLLYELSDPQGGRRSIVPLTDIPRQLIDATVMTEDASFYTNPGVDFSSILRAAEQDVVHHQVVSGASTITQQLVRNVLLDPQERQSQTLSRKIGEAVLAFRVDQRYSKDEILARYLNEIYYGNLAYGVEAASETYFGKPVQQLDLAQAALIAGLPQSPVAYDPYQHPDTAKARQREVLALMVRHGAITQEQADAVEPEPLAYKPLSPAIQAPHFVMYVRNLLEQRYSRAELYQQGLRIYTSLDLDLQHQVESVVHDRLPLLQQHATSNAAVVVLDARSGEILAMVGSADFWNDALHGQINMTTAERPPGATIETFTYLAAIDRHLIMPATRLADAPAAYSMGAGQPPYQPRDADGQFRGPVTARRALANSLNVPAVALLNALGVDRLLTTLHQFGVTSLPNDAGRYGLALTLGDEPVSLLDLSYAYAALANGGSQVGEATGSAEPDQRRYAPVAILKVANAQGQILTEYRPPSGAPLVSPQAAWLTTNILSDDRSRAETMGAHSPLELPDQLGTAAAKTGLSENLQDAWTIGYTPGIVVGVWTGNLNNQSIDGSFGSQGAALVWHDVMGATLMGTPTAGPIQPPGLVQATVDAATGLLPVPGRPTITDWFVAGTVPTEHVAVPTPAAAQTAAPAPPRPAPAPRPAAAPAPKHGHH